MPAEPTLQGGKKSSPRLPLSSNIAPLDSADFRFQDADATPSPRPARGPRSHCAGARGPGAPTDDGRADELCGYVRERGRGRLPRQPRARRGARPSLRDGHDRARQADLLRYRLRPNGDIRGRSGGVREGGGLPPGEHPRRGSGGEGSRARRAARAGGTAARAAAEAGGPRCAGLQPRRQRRLRAPGREPLRAKRARADRTTRRREEPRPEPRLLQGRSTRDPRVTRPGVHHLGSGADGGSPHHRRHAARLPTHLRAAARPQRAGRAHCLRARPDAPSAPQDTPGQVPRADLRLRQRGDPASPAELGYLRSARLVRDQLRGPTRADGDPVGSVFARRLQDSRAGDARLPGRDSQLRRAARRRDPPTRARGRPPDRVRRGGLSPAAVAGGRL